MGRGCSEDQDKRGPPPQLSLFRGLRDLRMTPPGLPARLSGATVSQVMSRPALGQASRWRRGGWWGPLRTCSGVKPPTSGLAATPSRSWETRPVPSQTCVPLVLRLHVRRGHQPGGIKPVRVWAEGAPGGQRPACRGGGVQGKPRCPGVLLLGVCAVAWLSRDPGAMATPRRPGGHPCGPWPSPCALKVQPVLGLVGAAWRAGPSCVCGMRTLSARAGPGRASE